MGNRHLDVAFQDEMNALQFVLDSPWHAVVLGRIEAAMQKYEQAMHSAVMFGNTGKQQEIALITRFLKDEASDRVNIKFEYLVVSAFETLCGSAAVDALLDYQSRFIADHQGAEWAVVPDCHKLELEYEEAGLCLIPSWGMESGRASIAQQTRLRLARHHLFNLNREMHSAYRCGERKRGWSLKSRCQDARKLIGPLANLECKSKALTSIKALHGEVESQRVLAWVKANTRLVEYEKLRNSIQAKNFTTPAPNANRLLMAANTSPKSLVQMSSVIHSLG
jgi:hypothetical protein